MFVERREGVVKSGRLSAGAELKGVLQQSHREEEYLHTGDSHQIKGLDQVLDIGSTIVREERANARESWVLRFAASQHF